MERIRRYALGIAWVVIGVALSVSLTFGAYSLGNDGSGAPTLSKEIQAVARPKQQVVKSSPASGAGNPLARPGLPTTAGGGAVSALPGSFADDGQGEPVNVSGSSNSGSGSSNSGSGSANSGTGSSDSDQSDNSGSGDDDDRDGSGSGGGDD